MRVRALSLPLLLSACTTMNKAFYGDGPAQTPTHERTTRVGSAPGSQAARTRGSELVEQRRRWRH
jgi:hypothetical protein